MTFIREMRRLLKLAAAVTIAGSAFIAAPAQAATVNFGNCTSGGNYQSVAVDATGNFTISCQAQNGTGTIAFNPSTYSVNAGSSNTVVVTYTRTGGSSGTAQSSASISGGCSVAPGQVTWADGDSASKTVTVTATPGATTCILSGGWSTSGGSGNITATVNVVDPNNPGQFAFSQQNSGVAINSAYSITVQRSGGTAGDWDVPFTMTPTGVTGQTFTPASPLQFRGASDVTKTIAINTGSTPGTMLFTFGTPVPVGTTPPSPAPTLGGNITVTVQAGTGGCPTPGANVITVGDMPAANGQHFLINGSAGQIMVTKLPSIAGFNAVITQTSTQGTGPITNIEMAISKCPGDMDWSRTALPNGAGQAYPWGGNIIYPCYGTSHILSNNSISLHINAVNNASFCNVPNSGGPYYLNVRYEMPSCPYGNGICGASFQWNQ